MRHFTLMKKRQIIKFGRSDPVKKGWALTIRHQIVIRRE
jgi:hypothetical protein